MSVTFKDIPEAVIEYIRNVFGEANNKVSRTLTSHPSMHEESLDHVLVAELTAAPPTFFSKERIAVAVELSVILLFDGLAIRLFDGFELLECCVTRYVGGATELCNPVMWDMRDTARRWSKFAET